MVDTGFTYSIFLSMIFSSPTEFAPQHQAKGQGDKNRLRRHLLDLHKRQRMWVIANNAELEPRPTNEGAFTTIEAVREPAPGKRCTSCGAQT
jgi:hypothetical protein